MKQPFRRSTPIWIYNKNEEFLFHLEPNSDNQEGIPHYNSWFIERLNGVVKLEFTVPADNPQVALIENDGRAVIRDKDGELVEFIIRRPQDNNGQNGPEKIVYAEGGDYELIDEWMTGYRANNVRLETALQAVTSHTRWSIGFVDDLGTQSVDMQPTTVKNAVVELINLFGGQVKYRVEADGNRITKRYIDVYRRRGEFNGKRFETGKDIRTISYTPDSTGVKTALYGYGASGENDGPRLTFSDVERRKEWGDPVDKPYGDPWVGDPDALLEWGYDGGRRHRFGEYSGQEEDPAELLLNTWNHLQSMTDKTRTYELRVTLLETIPGYEHEAVRIGDNVIVLDRDLQPNIEVAADIIEYRQNLNDDSLDEVTVGQFRNALNVAGRQRDLGKIIEDYQGNWNKKATPDDVIVGTNKAINEAQKRIDQAKRELEDAVERIEQGKIDLEDAEWLIQDTIDNPQNYKGDFVGDLIADSMVVRGPIISQSATITGRLLASGAVFVQADIERGNIIDANIENATITGHLDSVSGTFTGSLLGVRGTFAGELTSSQITIGGDVPNLDKWGNGSGFRIKMPIRDGGRWVWGGYFSIIAENRAVIFGGQNIGGFTFQEDIRAFRDLWVEGDLRVDGNIDGTVDDSHRLGGVLASGYSRTNHNHDGRYPRVFGSRNLNLELSSAGNLAIYDGGSYVGYIVVQ